MGIIGIITKASVSSLESSCFSKYSGAPQGHHVIFHAKGPPLPPPPYISLLYIIYHISLLHPRWDEQCRDTMMTVPPQLTSSLPSFSYPASFRHPPPASSWLSKVVSSGSKWSQVITVVCWMRCQGAPARACELIWCLPTMRLARWVSVACVCLECFHWMSQFKCWETCRFWPFWQHLATMRFLRIASFHFFFRRYDLPILPQVELTRRYELQGWDCGFPKMADFSRENDDQSWDFSEHDYI